MKNFIQKMLVLVFVSLALFSAGKTFASTQINTDTSDIDESQWTLRVASDSNCSGFACWKNSVSGVTSGDTLAFQVMFHNSGNETAQNVRIKIVPQSSGSTTSQTFTAYISADNASTVSQSVTVSFSGSQTATLDTNYSSLAMDPDLTQMSYPSVSSLGSSGVAIGNLATDATCTNGNRFCHQGTLVVHYKISGSNGGGNNQTPSVNTSSPSVNGTSVTLTGYAYPNGNTVDTCFKWGTSSSNMYNYVSVGTTSTSQNLSHTLSGLSSGTYYYQACVKQNGQEYDGPTQSFTIGSNNNDVSVRTDGYTQNTTSATINGYAYSNSNNSNYVTTYFKWGTSYSNLYNRTNNVSQVYGGSMSAYLSGLSSNTTYYYQACMSDSYYGERCADVRNFTTDGYVYNPPVVNSNVVATTLPATGVTAYSAQIEGLVINNNGGSATCWFQYGKTTALGNTTSAQSIGSTNSAKCYDTISGLTANTFYFYRIIADPTVGPNAYGEIRTFRTFGGETIPTETVRTTRVIRTVVEAPRGVTTIAVGSGTGSNLVQLAVDSRYDTVCANEAMDYTVTYKNISNKDITNVVLKVLLPTEVDFTNSSAGVYSQSDHSVIVTIGTLKSGDEQVMHVIGTLSNSVVVRDNLVATATMIYTHPVTSAQENAIAYKLNQVVPCSVTNSLGGLALFGNGFFPTTLIGWLILLLILLGITYLAHRLYTNRRTVTVAHVDNMHLPH